jgi:hypothetical protein
VDCLRFATNALGHVAYLALLGFLAIILIGPAAALLGVLISVAAALLSVAVALLSALLPFAVIGALIWLPYQLLTHRPTIDRDRVRQGARAVYQKVVVPPAHWCAQGCRWTAQAAPSAWEKCHSALGRAGGVLLETLCGAIILGVLAGLLGAGLGPKHVESYCAVGILLGAGFGFVVGLANHAARQDAASPGGGESSASAERKAQGVGGAC